MLPAPRAGHWNSGSASVWASPCLAIAARAGESWLAWARTAANPSAHDQALAQQLAKAYAVSQSPAITPDAQRGAQLFAQQCSVCHGNGGQGDGPASIGMQPAPITLWPWPRSTNRRPFASDFTISLP